MKLQGEKNVSWSSFYRGARGIGLACFARHNHDVNRPRRRSVLCPRIPNKFEYLRALKTLYKFNIASLKQLLY